MFRPALACVAAIACLPMIGCVPSTLDAADRPASRPVEGIGRGYFDHRVEAFVVPPQDWKPDPPKISDRHVHLAWISPSGKTAYGVIRMNLPLPFIGPEPVLRAFLDEMRKTGRIDLRDDTLAALQPPDPSRTSDPAILSMVQALISRRPWDQASRSDSRASRCEESARLKSWHGLERKRPKRF